MRRAISASVRAATLCVSTRQFFGKGWDNAALDVVYRHLVRKPEVHDTITTQYARRMDGKAVQTVLENAKIAAEHNTAVRLFLPVHLGDPHRLLKAYSLTAYPILDEQGEQLIVNVDGHDLPAFADPDDDFSKVCIPNLELTEYLATELLKTFDWEATPRGAASFLEALYRGAEVPDHVFQTPAVVERKF
jgi:hypothetical protein